MNAAAAPTASTAASASTAPSTAAQSAKSVLTVLRNVILKNMVKGGEAHPVRLDDVERNLYQRLLPNPKYAAFRDQLPRSTEDFVDGMVADQLVVRESSIRIHPRFDVAKLHRRLYPLRSDSNTDSNADSNTNSNTNSNADSNVASNAENGHSAANALDEAATDSDGDAELESVLSNVRTLWSAKRRKESARRRRLQQTVDALKAQKLQSEESAKQWTARCDAQKEEVLRLKTVCGALQSERDRVAAKLKQKEHEEAASEKTNALLLESQQRLRAERDALSAQKQELQQRLDAMDAAAKELRADLAAKSEAMEQLQRQMEVTEQSNRILMAQCAAAREQRDSAEGSPISMDGAVNGAVDAINGGADTIDGTLFEAESDGDGASMMMAVEGEALKERVAAAVAELERKQCAAERENVRRVEAMKGEYEDRIAALGAAVRKYKGKQKQYKEECRRKREEIERMREMDWKGHIVREYQGEDGQTLYDMQWDVSLGMTAQDVSEEDVRKWKKRKRKKM